MILYSPVIEAQQKMYWTDFGTDKIQRANLDGSNVEDLVTTGLSGPRGIALDLANGKMYWADAGTGGNRREAAIRCNNSWRTDGIRLRGVENVPME